MANPPTIAEVDSMLAQWRDLAGPDWRGVFRKRLEIHRRSFEGGRPVAAWEALLECRLLEISPPMWVMTYLSTCAGGIYNLLDASMAGKKIKPEEIARAIGMATDGSGTVFSDYSDWQWVAVGMAVKELVDAGDKETFAIEAVAKYYKSMGFSKVSKTTVRRHWKRLHEAYPATKSVSKSRGDFETGTISNPANNAINGQST